VTVNCDLRDVVDADLEIFFVQQLDPEANRMAAFTAKDPADHAAFVEHWARTRADSNIIIRTIVVDDTVAGYVLSYVENDGPEITYWLGRSYWGRGIGSAALKMFLERANPSRPMRARVAKDNAASLRVLQKCGFRIVGEDRGFAQARGTETEEFILGLDAAGA
jgi:RimJ/RimL family protein N-acetyltransferase